MCSIDSVVFRIHDLKTNQGVADLFYDQTFAAKKHYDININSTSYLSFVNKNSHTDHNSLIESVTYDNDKTKVKLTGYISPPSSHWNIHFFTDVHGDFIQFNFSIPKYVYGTNVFQFQSNPWDHDFSFPKSREITSSISTSYSRFIKFLKEFMFENFGTQVPLKYLEIVTIDICHNQVFNTKQDALNYLSILKRHRAKFARDLPEGTYTTDRPTTVEQISSSEYRKVYHKGTEYYKKDKREHIKVNEMYGEEIFHIEKLQELADRTLRYESRYIPSNMSPIYKRKIYRKHDKEWNEKMNRYKQLRSKCRSGTEMMNLNAREKEMYRIMDKHFRHGHRFYLGVSPENLKAHEENIDGDHVREALFSSRLLNELMIDHTKYIHQYQLKRLPDLPVIMERIRLHNNSKIPKFNSKSIEQPKKINPSKLTFLIDLLERMSLDEAKSYIINQGIASERTVYRWINDLQKIGVDKQVMSGFSSILPNIDHVNYYSFIVTNLNMANHIDRKPIPKSTELYADQAGEFSSTELTGLSTEF